jgi:hypothetical protein
MAENNDNDNNNNNNEDKQGGFLTDVLHRLATPLRVINQIRNLEEHLGLKRTALFQDYNSDNNNEDSTALPEQQENEHQERIQEEEPSPIIMLTKEYYSFGGLKIDFDDEEPSQNTHLKI